MRRMIARIAMTAALLAVISGLAAPGLGQQSLPKFRQIADGVPDRYVVVFTDSAAGPLGSMSRAPQLARDLTALHGGRLRLTFHHALNGFVVELPEAAARSLSADPRVEYVIQDGHVTAFDTEYNPPSWPSAAGLDNGLLTTKYLVLDMRKGSPTLTPQELVIMKVVWRLQKVTVDRAPVYKPTKPRHQVVGARAKWQAAPRQTGSDYEEADDGGDPAGCSRRNRWPRSDSCIHWSVGSGCIEECTAPSGHAGNRVGDR